MEWLSQNWMWLALGIGAILLMSGGFRGGRGGCCGDIESRADSGSRASAAPPPAKPVDAGEGSPR